MQDPAPTLEEGYPAPLGAHADSDGVNFAVFSAHAEGIDLCLFDAPDGPETARLRLPGRTGDVHHGRAHGMRPGQLYGLRAHGPFAPARGHRFNPAKLLLDPYARRLAGAFVWDDALHGDARPDPGTPGTETGIAGGTAPDPRDSAPFVPKGVVVAPAPPEVWVRPPRRPLVDGLVYEAQVRALTRLHPDVPEAMRGTYAALGHPAIVAHLARLGVTALELLPLQTFLDERALVARGLRNAWGYQPMAYFVPEARFGDPADLVGAVHALHAAGIEVILDVVYNHTGEGDHLGPTLSYRGLDNASYYKLDPADPSRDLNWAGTGNALDGAHPRVAELVVASLRHWVEAYGVDGFRFDLATMLGRDPHDFTPRAGLFARIAADPVLAGVRLVAEPWDVGPGGYQVGNFPAGWAEWNDHFRDGTRRFWRGDEGALAQFTQGLAGSKEIYQRSGRGPEASVNYVCSHDGFTLADLVAYRERHNWANGEANGDGHRDNLSWNHGVEGPSDDPAVRAARARDRRALLASLLLAQGAPMLLMGDEFARTQGGNNNAYAQDNAILWVDWSGREDPDLPGYVAALTRLRRRHRALRHRGFLTGTPTPGGPDVVWLAPDGSVMEGAAWADGTRRAFGMRLNCPAGPADDPIAAGGEGGADHLLLLFNAAPEAIEFRLAPAAGGPWTAVFDSTRPTGEPAEAPPAGDRLHLEGRAVRVLAPAIGAD